MTLSEDGTITPETPADKYACGTLAYAAAVSPVWPASVRRAATAETGALLDALEIYEAIERNQIHPASEYDDLAGHPEAKHEALGRAADAIADLTAELVRVFPACAIVAEKVAA